MVAPAPPSDDRSVDLASGEGGDRSPEDARVESLIEHTLDVPVLAEAVAQQEAADAADTLERLDDRDAAEVIVAMDDQAAAAALAEMEAPLAAGMLEDLIADGEVPYAARLLRCMPSDDAADLLQSIDPAEQEVILAAMPAAASAGLRRLLHYHEETAAGLMTTDFLVLTDDMTVGLATEAIRGSSIPDEQHDLPVVDHHGVLVGLVGLRDLLLSRAGRVVGELADTKVRAVPADLDREAVAREFDRYDHDMLPVLDDEGRLLGVITVDDVIDIIRAEQTEDVQKTVGAGAGEAVYSSLGEKFRGRFPWLLTSLFMTCGAAVVVLLFEDLVRDYPIVAFLMPVIAALVGNAGHQALAVTLRGIVLDEVRPERVRPLVTRELFVGMCNGLVLGAVMTLIVGGLSFVVDGATWKIGLVAGIALTVSMGSGTLAGSGIPLIMRRLGADPAQSSAIFLILVTDAVAFSAFLSLAWWAHRL